jgi:hypothetical protein
VPCQPLYAPLEAWREHEPRNFGQLSTLLQDGLLQCPFAGVDLEALEYILTLLFAR